MAHYRKREHTYSRGWWQTQQDRLQITGRFPPMPFHEETPGNLLPSILQKMNLKEDAWRVRIMAVWKDLVGETLAAHTRPGLYDRGVLTVYVHNSIWLSELTRYGKKQMLARLQNHFGADRVQRMVLRIDPDLH